MDGDIVNVVRRDVETVSYSSWSREHSAWIIDHSLIDFVGPYARGRDSRLATRDEAMQWLRENSGYVDELGYRMLYAHEVVDGEDNRPVVTLADAPVALAKSMVADAGLANAVRSTLGGIDELELQRGRNPYLVEDLGDVRWGLRRVVIEAVLVDGLPFDAVSVAREALAVFDGTD